MTYDDLLPLLPVEFELGDNKKRKQFISFLKNKFESPWDLKQKLNKYKFLTQSGFNKVLLSFRSKYGQNKGKISFDFFLANIFKEFSGEDAGDNPNVFSLMKSLISRNRRTESNRPRTQTKRPSYKPSKEEIQARKDLWEDEPYVRCS